MDIKAILENDELIKPKVGIAFGGGGIRGMAHLGFMEELEKTGIVADMVAGSSIGSCMAALYAGGFSGTYIIRLLDKMDLKLVMPFKPSAQGLIDGKNYETFVRVLTNDGNIEDSPIPLRIVATDLQNGKKHVFSEGNIARAVHCSSAIPTAFKPVEYLDTLFVDGCLMDNVPCKTLKEMGADIVIGIDLDPPKSTKTDNVVNVIQRTVDVLGQRHNSGAYADVLLSPFDEYISALSLAKADFCLERGRNEAKSKIPEFEALYVAKTLELNGLDK